ncbi:MAG: hypothetical protein H7Y17_17405 [Chlorobia bacterium]|nr:hypothetical protein [Fimbriimonadaceae bacterium]
MVLAALVIGAWYVLPPSYLDLPIQHTRHEALFSRDAPIFNRFVLKGVDDVQSTAMLGGGYFIGIKAKPTESPIGYPLCLKGDSLLNPPRTTSFCTGASYAAFIEALNRWMPLQGRAWINENSRLPATIPLEFSDDRMEAMRMQEPDGSRREDHVKFWGHWNADGFGNHFALVQYSKVGERIKPENARPGDFLNISWKSGLGHSTVFLGWCLDEKGRKAVRFWSSQKGTNGLGDQVSALETIREVCIVRVSRPRRIFDFDPKQAVEKKVVGDTVDW